MKLEELHKNKKPQVPEGYFEKHPATVLDQVKKERISTPTFKLNVYWSAAAGVAFLLAATFFSNMFDPTQVHQENSKLPSLSEMSYYEYIDLYISEFETEELYTSTQKTTTNTNNDETTPDQTDATPNATENLEEILLEENDIEQIIELLWKI